MMCEMIDADVAVKLDKPIYTDMKGNEVEESKRFGLKQIPIGTTWVHENHP